MDTRAIMPMLLYKYGRREHLDQMISKGTVQIGTVYGYDEATHGPRIGDDNEGRSRQVFTDENTRGLSGEVRLPSLFGVPMFNSPDSYGNVAIQDNIGFNYAIYCVSRCLHRALCKDFCDEYDCAVVVLRPFVFFHHLTNAFQESGLVDAVRLCQVDDVQYRSRELAPDEGDLVEALIKEPHYQRQAEVRGLWNVGDHPSEKFYLFDAPAVASCSRLIPFDALPSYEPGSPREVVEGQVIEALRRSEGRGN